MRETDELFICRNYQVIAFPFIHNSSIYHCALYQGIQFLIEIFVYSIFQSALMQFFNTEKDMVERVHLIYATDTYQYKKLTDRIMSFVS